LVFAAVLEAAEVDDDFESLPHPAKTIAVAPIRHTKRPVARGLNLVNIA
jgi:hypothetical protein